MKKPQSLKGYLTLMLALADTQVLDLKGCKQLNEEQYEAVVTLVAQIQNMLGEDLKPVLSHYKLQWEG